MKPFRKHNGLVATLDLSNVDTDQIIPKQFLKSIKRTGFGEHLFSDWRYLPNGKPDPKFSLNEPRFKNATILVARNNFGCGSSREHAVWAVQQYGFAVVIAPWREVKGTRVPGFADIFRNNCGKNGVLAVELSEAEVETIFQVVEKETGLRATVDLEKQTVTLAAKLPVSFSFDIDTALKDRLLHGLDDIGISLQHASAITAFEKTHATQIRRR